MICTILIIGGGQAGAQAIDTLRREGFGGRLVLIGDEPELPYQRPPLSKKYLSGEMPADRLLFRHRSFYDEHRIELKLGRQAVRLDAAARQVELADGEKLTYDRLLLCLGAESRRLTCPGAALPGVHYLREIADVAPIQAGFKPQARVVIIGVGAVATTELARAAGLACDNGIVVDEYCRTSDAAIYAAGDCTNHPSLRFGRRVRLESVDNAFEQAKAAALNLLDRPVAHDRVPWFWSDQFDNKLLIVGLSQDHDRQVLRGDPASRSFSVCYLKGRELLAVEAVNHSKDYMAGRELIAERALMHVERLADDRIALKEAI